MSRNFYVTGRPASSGGLTAGRPSLRAEAPRDSYPLPSRPNAAANHSFKPLDIPEPPLNIAALALSMIFVSVTGVGLGLALFALFFLEIH